MQLWFLESAEASFQLRMNVVETPADEDHACKHGVHVVGRQNHLVGVVLKMHVMKDVLHRCCTGCQLHGKNGPSQELRCLEASDLCATELGA